MFATIFFLYSSFSFCLPFPFACLHPLVWVCVCVCVTWKALPEFPQCHTDRWADRSLVPVQQSSQEHQHIHPGVEHCTLGLRIWGPKQANTSKKKKKTHFQITFLSFEGLVWKILGVGVVDLLKTFHVTQVSDRQREDGNEVVQQGFEDLSVERHILTVYCCWLQELTQTLHIIHTTQNLREKQEGEGREIQSQ